MIKGAVAAMDVVASGGAVAGGAGLVLYGFWRLFCRCNENAPRLSRYQNPRRCLQRRGKICGIGGAGLLAMGLAFWETSHGWGTAAVILWSSGILLVLLLNELLSVRD